MFSVIFLEEKWKMFHGQGMEERDYGEVGVQNGVAETMVPKLGLEYGNENSI
jgi:hypothetical protein